jgi:cell division protein FtsL
MARLNILLLLTVLVCALSLVTSQHKARKLLQAMEAEQERARQLEIEDGQLQLELSTLTKWQSIEQTARERLKMREPDASRIVTLVPGGGR